MDRTALPAHRQKRCRPGELHAGERTQLPQRVLIEVHVAVRLRWSGAGWRHGKISYEQVIVRKSEVDGRKPAQTAHKQPRAHHQQ